MRIARHIGALGVLLLLAALLVPQPAGASSTDSGDAVDDHAGHSHGRLDVPGVDELVMSFEQVVYDMYFPIQGGSAFNDNFGDCRGGAGCPRTHEGIDIMQPKMTPILAVSSGYVGWMHNDQGGDCCAMEINHDDGWESWYIHMNNDTEGTDDGQGWGFAPGVVPGARVEAGQLIGWVGDSGNAEWTAPHLHFELHKPGGVVINPYPSLQAATVLNAPLGNGHTRGCDFDDDGYDDLAVGVPGEDIAGNSIADGGSVTVLYGTSDGLDSAGAESFTQRSSGVKGAASSGAEFGFATACGDVNDDGYDDLIVGVPGDVVGGKADAGSVTLLLGSSSGLSASGSNRWHQNKGGVANRSEPGDRFGAALAVGDFNEDGHADVAVGVPGEKIRGENGAGMVTILYGGNSGFDGTSLALHEKIASIGNAEAGDGFGASLTAGDFDDDGRDDLAVGIPSEDSATQADLGAVIVLYGSGSGIDPASAERFSQGANGVDGSPNPGDRFGSSLKAGDFDGDGRFDLAIGVPYDMIGGVPAGSVNVIYGSGSGLSATGDQQFRQGAGGIKGTPAAGNLFGASLASGDFDGDGNQDLGIGVPGQMVSGLDDAGSVAVIYGSANGLTGAGDDVWHQDTHGIKGAAHASDKFGSWVATGDYAGAGVSSLAIGVPLEDIGAKVDGGATQVLAGRAGKGIVIGGDQKWDQRNPDLPGAAEAGDRFGRVAAPSS